MRLKDVSELCIHNTDKLYLLCVPNVEIDGLNEVLICFPNILRVALAKVLRLDEISHDDALDMGYTGVPTGSRSRNMLRDIEWL